MVHADAFGVRKTNVQPMIDAVNDRGHKGMANRKKSGGENGGKKQKRAERGVFIEALAETKCAELSFTRLHQHPSTPLKPSKYGYFTSLTCIAIHQKLH